MIPLIVLILVNIAFNIGLYGVFEKAGEKGWKALIPVYNYFIWNKLVGKPTYWFIVGSIPFIGLVVSLIWITETCKLFGKDTFKDHSLAQIFPFIYLIYLGFSKDIKWLGIDNVPERKKDIKREWGDAIIYAFVAAYAIRAFTFELYQIPTSSMEKSLLVGDYLIVNKFSYGARVPRTPLAIPFVHHTIPFFNIQGYINGVHLPYMRFPKFDEVERNDIVVFNYPGSDKHIIDVKAPYYRDYHNFSNKEINTFSSTKRMEDGGRIVYHTFIKNHALNISLRDSIPFNKAYKKALLDMNKYFIITERPVDKRENYIKRCVGIPGDKLEIVDRELRINDNKAFVPKNLQYKYIFKPKNKSKKVVERMFDKWDKEYDFHWTDNRYLDKYQVGFLTLTDEQFEKFKDFEFFESIELYRNSPSFDYSLMPNNPKVAQWTVDNFGPITIPKKGQTVELTDLNFALYKRVIGIYEGHEVEQKEDGIYIDGKKETTYTFEMDHYFMMGDNRHNSLDSRAWGFVPEDHIVGRPSLVLASRNLEYGFFDFSKWRWDRFLKIVDETE